MHNTCCFCVGAHQGVVRVEGGEGGRGLCGQFVQLRGRDALIDATDDFLGNHNCSLHT